MFKFIKLIILATLTSINLSSFCSQKNYHLPTVHELQNYLGQQDEGIVVGGPAGGLFMFSDKDSLLVDNGTVFKAPNGKWQRLDPGPIQSVWFDIPVFKEGEIPSKDDVDKSTRRFQKALNAAAGGMLYIQPGIYYVNDTLWVPQTTRIEGAGKAQTIIKTYGVGKARQWSDTGISKHDSFSTLLVCGGAGVRLRNFSLICENGWDAGITVPASIRNTFESISVKGKWQLAACLLDATWSERNKKMIELHKGRISPQSMNENTFRDCHFSGNWGLYVRGSLNRKVSDYKEPDWLWSYGGTSDLSIINCVLKGDINAGMNGGAFCHDAPVANARQAGQGHRYLSTKFISSNKHVVKLGVSTRDRFFSCTFEGTRFNDGGRVKKPIMKSIENKNWTADFISCEYKGDVDQKSEWKLKATTVTDRKFPWWQDIHKNFSLVQTPQLLPFQNPFPLAEKKALRTIRELKNTKVEESHIVAVLGYDSPGDGGAGLFRFISDGADLSVDEGTVFKGPGSSKWQRVYTGALEASWFGARPSINKKDIHTCTLRLQNALNATQGKTLQIGKGLWHISDTLIIPGNTTVIGRVPHINSYEHGTLIKCFGEGHKCQWTDTGSKEKDTFRAAIVLGGSNIKLSQTSINSDPKHWEVGVLIPTVHEVSIDNCEILRFQLAAVLKDATWSKKNEKLIKLHNNKIKPENGLRNCSIYASKLRGRWALMVRGAEDSNLKGINKNKSIWAPEGNSELFVSATRLQSSGKEGGAYYHNVPSSSPAEAHKFFSCRFHTDSHFCIKVKHTQNLNVTGSYLEGWGGSKGIDSKIENHKEYTKNSVFYMIKTVSCTWETWNK